MTVHGYFMYADVIHAEGITVSVKSDDPVQLTVSAPADRLSMLETIFATTFLKFSCITKNQLQFLLRGSLRPFDTLLQGQMIGAEYPWLTSTTLDMTNSISLLQERSRNHLDYCHRPDSK